MKYVIALVIVLALLTGCTSNKQYSMNGVTVVSKQESQYACRGVCYSHSVTIEKDGNRYTYKVDSDSYSLVEKGSVVDLSYYNGGMRDGEANLTPVGVKKEGR